MQELNYELDRDKILKLISIFKEMAKEQDIDDLSDGIYEIYQDRMRFLLELIHSMILNHTPEIDDDILPSIDFFADLEDEKILDLILDI